MEQLQREAEKNPASKDKSARYLQRLSSASQTGLPGLTDVPCFIVVAEHRGVPSVEKQSLAHVMENMWLKATALGLGFQLVSVVETLTENQEFSRLLRLPPDEFAFNGCIVGYPAQEPAERKAISEERIITWL